MRTLFLCLAMAVFPLCTFAQKVTPREPDMSIWAELFEAAGYELYSFDLEDMDVENVEVWEYSGGERIWQMPLIDENTLQRDDAPRPKRIDVGFYPSGNDSVKMMLVNVPDYCAIQLGRTMRKLPQVSHKTDYHTRPFKLDRVNEGFVPLVMLGSFWWDEKLQVARFCGENQLDGLESEMLHNLPHYYVIGINVKRKKLKYNG